MKQMMIYKKITTREMTLVSSIFTMIIFSTATHAAGCNIPKSYYKNVTCTSDSRYFLAVKDTGQPVALLNQSGKKSADLFAYDQVLYKKMKDGLLPVIKQGKVGYINGKGTIAVPLIYDALAEQDWARGFSNSRAVVQKNGKYGVINTNNKVIVPFSRYITQLGDFSAGKARMVKSGKDYWVNTRGQLKLIRQAKTNDRQPSARPQHPESRKDDNRQPLKKSTPNKAHSHNHQSRLSKKSNGRNTKSYTNSKRLTKTQSSSVSAMPKRNTETSLSEERINELLYQYKLIPTPQGITENNTKKIDQQSNSPQGNEQYNPSTLLAKQQIGKKLFPQDNDGKWGFVDENDVAMITYSFDQVTPFSNGLAGVRVADHWGFINKAGDLVIGFRFDESGVIRTKQTYQGMPPFMFYDNKAWVGNLNNGKKLCIDKEGTNVNCE